MLKQTLGRFLIAVLSQGEPIPMDGTRILFMKDKSMSQDRHYRAESLFAVIEVKLPVMITVKEAAIHLRKSVWTVRRWIKAGLIKHVQIGREYLILPSELPGCPQIEFKEAKYAKK